MPPERSPRAQAILRAIENEAQARRRRIDDQRDQHSFPAPEHDWSGYSALTTPSASHLHEAASRLMALVDHVVEQTEGVRARVREVEQSLDQLAAELARIPAPTQGPGAQPAGETVAPREPPSARPGEFDGARLVAIEMAVSGASRGEVGERLERDFDITNPAPILDDLFGAGSTDGSRMPWSS